MTRPETDLEELTANIKDARHKPLLRPQLILSLEDLGHNRVAAELAVEKFYSEVRLQ